MQSVSKEPQGRKGKHYSRQTLYFEYVVKCILSTWLMPNYTNKGLYTFLSEKTQLFVDKIEDPRCKFLHQGIWPNFQSVNLRNWSCLTVNMIQTCTSNSLFWKTGKKSAFCACLQQSYRLTKHTEFSLLCSNTLYCDTKNYFCLEKAGTYQILDPVASGEDQNGRILSRQWVNV